MAPNFSLRAIAFGLILFNQRRFLTVANELQSYLKKQRELTVALSNKATVYTRCFFDRRTTVNTRFFFIEKDGLKPLLFCDKATGINRCVCATEPIVFGPSSIIT